MVLSRNKKYKEPKNVHPKIASTIKSCTTYAQLTNCLNFLRYSKDIWVINRIKLLLDIQALKLEMEPYNKFVEALKSIKLN